MSSANDTENPIIYCPTQRPAQKRENSRLGKGWQGWEGAYRVPEGQLPLAHAAETSGKDVAVSQKDGPHGSGSFMCFLLLLGERAKRQLTQSDCRKEKWGKAGAQTVNPATPHGTHVKGVCVCACARTCTSVSVLATSPP